MLDEDLNADLTKLIGRCKQESARRTLLAVRDRLDEYHLLCRSPEVMDSRVKRYQQRIDNLNRALKKKQNADAEQQAIIRRLNLQIDEMRMERMEEHED